MDVAFAELFRPVLEEIAMEGKSGLELPPFTGIKVVVESSEVAGIGDVLNQEELEVRRLLQIWLRRRLKRWRLCRS